MPRPTGMTSRPPMASCCFSVSGTFGPPAETMMASNGRLLRQALGAVGEDDLGIGVAEPLQPLARQLASSSWRSMANTLLAMRLITAAA